MSRKPSSTVRSLVATLAGAGSVWLLFLPSPAAGQAAKALTPSYVAPRTPDGQPDIQGIYARVGVGGLAVEARESNGPHGAENPLDATKDNPLSVSERSDGLRNIPKGFNVGGVPLAGPAPAEKRRIGIVDPANKELPWKPEEEKKRREFLAKTNPAAGLRYVEFDARCALPGLFLNQGPFEFIQPEKEVVMISEYSHFTRTVHLDGRPHLNSAIRLFMGDSVGRWEGNTLIVDTTNFNQYGSFSREIPYLSDALHTTERFTIADQNNIDYEVTIDDPKLFTKPWKTAGLFRRTKKGYEIMEYACAEGSLTLENIFGKPPERQ